MKGIAMILHSNHIATIQKLAFSQDEIVKVFKSAKQVRQFNDFVSNSIDSIEIATDKLIKLANSRNIPFAYLFLPELPKIENALPDFRADSRDFSPNLQSCIGASKKKQEWFRNYLKRNGYNKFLNDKEIKSNADIIREIKILIDFDNVRKKTKSERFTHIKQALEPNNIIVQQSGMSQNQTQKPISITECRGYAIYDEYAPLIFINSNDSSVNGKIFTLLHELAHILLKHSGVSSYDFFTNEEYQCNEIAGEILMPTNEFTRQWDKNINLESNINKIYAHFNEITSPLAIATKALLAKLINNNEYQEFKETYLTSITKIKKKSGGDYYANIAVANSKNFAKSVIIDTLNGYETYKDAMDLLDIKSLKSFNTLAEKLRIR